MGWTLAILARASHALMAPGSSGTTVLGRRFFGPGCGPRRGRGWRVAVPRKPRVASRAGGMSPGALRLDAAENRRSGDQVVDARRGSPTHASVTPRRVDLPPDDRRGARSRAPGDTPPALFEGEM